MERPSVSLLSTRALKPTRSLAIAEAEDVLFDNLQRLVTEAEGRGGNYLVVSAGDVYAQFAKDYADEMLQWELVSNRHLPEPLKLTASKVDGLRTLGFEDPDGPRDARLVRSQSSGRELAGRGNVDSPNFVQYVPVPGEGALRTIAAVSVQILTDIYRCPREQPLTVALVVGAHIDPRHPVPDARLLAYEDEKYGLCFASVRRNRAIRSALAARTWGELRERAGETVYAELADISGGGADNDAFCLADETMSSEHYWPFPAQEMLHWVPQDIQEQFGRVDRTIFSGEYLEFRERGTARVSNSRLREVLQAFLARGFRFTRDEPWRGDGERAWAAYRDLVD